MPCNKKFYNQKHEKQHFKKHLVDPPPPQSVTCHVLFEWPLIEYWKYKFFCSLVGQQNLSEFQEWLWVCYKCVWKRVKVCVWCVCVLDRINKNSLKLNLKLKINFHQRRRVSLLWRHIIFFWTKFAIFYLHPFQVWYHRHWKREKECQFQIQTRVSNYVTFTILWFSNIFVDTSASKEQGVDLDLNKISTVFEY